LFCFGTELVWLQRPCTGHNSFIIRKIYSGKLTYAANWDDFDKVPWNQLDYIGIDALPLSEAITPTVAELNKS
jgi:hypothetical protein